MHETPYRVEFSPVAANAFQTLSLTFKKELLNIFETLTINPHHMDARKLKGMLGLRRMPHGSYTILYRIEEKRPKVVVLDIFNRHG
ncbi:MAG: type II toxin-antitoxin system RelE family toxin [Gammaproteobacteria bacterium]